VIKDKQKAARFIRFCAVGVGNTVLDLGIFRLLTYLGASFLVAQVLSYSAGVVNSYILNRKWTFRVQGRVDVPQAVKFVVVNLLSLLVSTGVLSLLYKVLHVDLTAAKILAMASAPIVNFIGNILWVFTEKQTMRSDLNEG
jgi:putative flippase GtrA